MGGYRRREVRRRRLSMFANRRDHTDSGLWGAVTKRTLEGQFSVAALSRSPETVTHRNRRLNSPPFLH